MTALAVSLTATPPESDLHGWFARHPGLVVVGVRNPVLETLGHHPTSAYAERYWLPTLGPSATWLHRNLVARLDEHPRGYPVHLPTLAREIGLGAGSGRNAPVVRTLTRLVDFRVAEIVDGQLGVHTMLPPLSRRQAAHLPNHLAERHREDLALIRPRRSTAAVTRAVVAAELGP